MGQEILYCNKCGKRLVGDDFTRGRAHTYNNRQYCTNCLPEHHTAGPQEGSRSRSSTGRRLKPPTARASRSPDKSGAMLMVGVGFGIAAAGVIAVVLMSRPEPPPPETVIVKHVPVPVPVSAPTPIPAGPSKEKLAEDLKELEGKVQKLVAAEQFVAAADLLGEARKRHSVPDWDQPIAKRLKEVQDIPAGLYASLKERATGAHLRGATADVQQERARVDRWGRKDLLDELDKALAQLVPSEPLPAGAKVLLRYPPHDPSRYNLSGEVKDGAVLGVPAFAQCMMVGFERGNEIFKVPEEGEVRVVFTTTSPKLVTVVVRAFTPEGKNFPYNYWLEKPEVGRPQVIKIPVAVLKSWDQKPITAGAIVDNVYIRQDGLGAVLKIHEFVIFATKP